MNDIQDLKDNLLKGLLQLKSDYPDCTWLKECIEMNRPNTGVTDVNLTLELTERNLALISQN